MEKLNIKDIIDDFIKDNKSEYSVYKSMEYKKSGKEFKQYVYNEFSFQHELGNYLRENLNKKENKNNNEEYIIKFEYNINNLCKDINGNDDNAKNLITCKREIDIVILKVEKEKIKEVYAIELKYLKNKDFPYRMFQCVKDMRFMKDILTINEDIIKGTYCAVVTENEGFFEDDNETNDYIISEKLFAAYKVFWDKTLKDKKKKLKKRIKQLEENSNEYTEVNRKLIEVQKQESMISDIIAEKNNYPTIYKYFRRPNDAWKNAEYIYSNLTKNLEAIDVRDLNIQLEWNSVIAKVENKNNNETENYKYYIIELK